MDKDAQKELRDYAWKYFSLHADQRLKTFHFFVLLSTVIMGAILTIAKDLSNIGYATPLAYLLSILAFVFWKLDQRNRDLIKHGENALKYIEGFSNASGPDMEPNISNLFLYEEWKTSNKLRDQNIPLEAAHFSFSDCFNILFSIFGVAGFLLGCIFLVKSAS